jgi:hypothetical protein
MIVVRSTTRWSAIVALLFNFVSISPMPPIPTTGLQQLQATHSLGCALVRRAGFEPEPVEVAIKVEEHNRRAV